MVWLATLVAEVDGAPGLAGRNDEADAWDAHAVDQRFALRGGLPWWSTDQTILAKGRELKLDPRPGESMAQFKGRVSEAIAHLEGHP